MSLFINSFQLLERGVGIDLRRRDALMTQQVLDTFKTGTVVQHRCGKGVAKHVRRPFLQRSHHREVLANNQIHLIASHPLTFVTQEQRLMLICELRVAYSHEMLQLSLQLLPEGNDALLVPFTRHFQLLGTEVYISIVQSCQL